jgi:hypothetical protein
LEISLNEPETWEYSLVKGNGKENLTNYIQLAIVAESKTQFPFIVFDKKLGKYAGSTRFYDINLEFKTSIRFYLVWETVSWYWFK